MDKRVSYQVENNKSCTHQGTDSVVLINNFMCTSSLSGLQNLFSPSAGGQEPVRWKGVSFLPLDSGAI